MACSNASDVPKQQRSGSKKKLGINYFSVLYSTSVKVNQWAKDSEEEEEEEEEVEDLRFLHIVMTIIWLLWGGLDSKILLVFWAPKLMECIFCSEKYTSYVRCCVLLVTYQTRRNWETSVRLLCGGYFTTHFISRVQTAVLSSIDNSIPLKFPHGFVSESSFSVIFSFQLNLMCIINALKDKRIFTVGNWSPPVAFRYLGWRDCF
jgi:hypothetical protein